VAATRTVTLDWEGDPGKGENGKEQVVTGDRTSPHFYVVRNRKGYTGPSGLRGGVRIQKAIVTSQAPKRGSARLVYRSHEHVGIGSPGGFAWKGGTATTIQSSEIE